VVIRCIDSSFCRKFLPLIIVIGCIPSSGIVDLELDFEDGTTRLFSVNPVQASLIMHMADNRRMGLSDLSMLCKMEEEQLDLKMGYWVTKGVLAQLD
jgi:hypothetical protein